jgi:RNA-directed DNA polymerase
MYLDIVRKTIMHNMTSFTDDGSLLDRRVTVVEDGSQDASESKWFEVNWKCVGKSVRRLRQRIFKYSRNGNLAKVRLLQRLLISNKENILYSIRAVTSNKGRNTAGVGRV